MDKKLTAEQGFQAMAKFLKKWYGLTRSDDIAFLLSGMNSDPAFFQDWVEFVDEVLREQIK